MNVCEEAIRALHAALTMNDRGKHDKAHKLFQQALTLSPKHPDILNFYGEFLEKTQKNVVEAYSYYTKSLLSSSHHKRALENHQRLLPLIEELDNDRLERIDRKRKFFQKCSKASIFERLRKEEHMIFIYHCAGIEGNTMDLTQTRTVIEEKVAIGGKSLIEHNELLGLDNALHYINSTEVEKVGELTLQGILEIHRRVLGYVDLEEAGRLRDIQVFVGNYTPPEPSELEDSMKDFITWINSPEALSLHPVRYAALAHYKLVSIHPFTDGNGRTSRVLMNLLLIQAGFPLVTIVKSHRESYFEYLEQIRAGDDRQFIRFIADCAEEALDVFI